MQIRHLQLQTNQLEAQAFFYTQVLGFELLQKTDTTFRVQIGHSILEFQEVEEAAYYHFALNIPAMQVEGALAWIRGKAPVIKEEENEIVDFKHWNALAVYFFDPALNIVELIARKNLNLPAVEVFDQRAVQGISEIGLPVGGIAPIFQQLADEAGLEKYSGNLENFCAAGDEEGLFILVNKEEKFWYPSSIRAKAFPLSASIHTGELAYLISFDVQQQLTFSKTDLL